MYYVRVGSRDSFMLLVPSNLLNQFGFMCWKINLSVDEIVEKDKLVKVVLITCFCVFIN